MLSLLPKSYPGQSILTEDIGEIIENNCEKCREKRNFWFTVELKNQKLEDVATYDKKCKIFSWKFKL